MSESKNILPSNAKNTSPFKSLLYILLAIFAIAIFALAICVSQYGLHGFVADHLRNPLSSEKKVKYCTIYDAKVNNTSSSRINEVFIESNVKISNGSFTIFTQEATTAEGIGITEYIKRQQDTKFSLLNHLEILLGMDQSLHLVSIGGGGGVQLGLPACLAGLLGRKVVAVEPDLTRLGELERTWRENGFDNSLLTQVQNTISDYRGQILYKKDQFVQSARRKKSISLSSKKIYQKRNFNNPGSILKVGVSAKFIKAIYFDDLLEVISFQKAILVINIEFTGSEGLQHADQFFKKIDIRYIIVQWSITNLFNRRLLPRIAAFLTERNYKLKNPPSRAKEGSEKLEFNWNFSNSIAKNKIAEDLVWEKQSLANA